MWRLSSFKCVFNFLFPLLCVTMKRTSARAYHFYLCDLHTNRIKTRTRLRGIIKYTYSPLKLLTYYKLVYSGIQVSTCVQFSVTFLLTCHRVKSKVLIISISLIQIQTAKTADKSWDNQIHIKLIACCECLEYIRICLLCLPQRMDYAWSNYSLFNNSLSTGAKRC